MIIFHTSNVTKVIATLLENERAASKNYQKILEGGVQ